MNVHDHARGYLFMALVHVHELVADKYTISTENVHGKLWTKKTEFRK